MYCVYLCVYRHGPWGRGVLPDDFAHPVLSVDTFFLSSLLPPVSALVLCQCWGSDFEML